MAKNKRYTLKYRRRREGRTNYHKRLNLLKSRKPRLVIRRSNGNMIVQIISYDPDGDKVIAQARTQELESMGWKGSTSNIPASYLAGLLAGVRAKEDGVTQAVVDLGMQNASHGGRLFAAVKGAIDAGIESSVGEGAFPSEERLQGAHIDEGIAKSIESVKKKIGA